MLKKFLTKKVLSILGGLLLTVGVGGYLIHIIKENGRLEDAVNQFEQTNQELNQTIREQQKEMKRREQLVEDLRQKEQEIDNELKQTQQELDQVIKESEDECVPSDIPDDILDQLRDQDS